MSKAELLTVGLFVDIEQRPGVDKRSFACYFTHGLDTSKGAKMSTESRLRWKYITILLATGEVISTHGKLFGTMDAIDMLLITSKLMPEELDEEHFINMSSRDSVELVGNLFFQARHEGSLRYISYRGKYTPTADTSKRLEALVREFFSLTTEEMLELCSRAYDLLCKHGNGWNVIHELNLRSSPAT